MEAKSSHVRGRSAATFEGDEAFVRVFKAAAGRNEFADSMDRCRVLSAPKYPEWQSVDVKNASVLATLRDDVFKTIQHLDIFTTPEIFKNAHVWSAYETQLQRRLQNDGGAIRSVAIHGPMSHMVLAVVVRLLPRLRRLNLATAYPVSPQSVHLAMNAACLHELHINMLPAKGCYRPADVVAALCSAAHTRLQHLELYQCGDMDADAHRPLFVVRSLQRLCIRHHGDRTVATRVPGDWEFASGPDAWVVYDEEHGPFRGATDVQLQRIAVTKDALAPCRPLVYTDVMKLK